MQDGNRSEAATPSAGQVVLGLTALASRRWRASSSAALEVAVGMAASTADTLRPIATTALRPPARLARRALDGAHLPDPVRRRVAAAQVRGGQVVYAGRAEVAAFVRRSLERGVYWAEHRAAPHVLDELVPHLVNSVLPRVVEGLRPHLEPTVLPRIMDAILPYVREQVLPVIIDDLAHDPQLRTLFLEQSRGVVSETADQLRDAAAHADDRVEGAFRRLVHRAAHPSSTPQ